MAPSKSRRTGQKEKFDGCSTPIRTPVFSPVRRKKEMTNSRTKFLATTTSHGDKHSAVTNGA